MLESHNKILEVLKPYLDAKFVYDPAVNEIYLAIWINYFRSRCFGSKN